jgi:hypothetical protein
MTGVTVGSTATYTCNDNYQLKGASDMTGVTVGSTATYTCNDNYQLKGASTVGSTATYTCNDNYQLKGASTRMCQPDGTWSGEEPSCDVSPEIQLHGGTHRCEGLLRVKRYRYWSNACNNYFIDEEKEVACRQLGCGPLQQKRMSITPPDRNWVSLGYNCSGDESELCECQKTGTSCSLRPIIVACENKKCQKNKHIKDPVIEIKGGPDRCDGQLLISGVYNGNYTQVIMCERYPTLEMAETICRQLKCGPPTKSKPFAHTFRYIPPSKLYDRQIGYSCDGSEPGLGCCNPTKSTCFGQSDVLSLTCARADPALTMTRVCSPVSYRPRPVRHRTSNGVEYICHPTGNTRLCPNILDANGRRCKGPANTRGVPVHCSQTGGGGPTLTGTLAVTYHAYCTWQ